MEFDPQVREFSSFFSIRSISYWANLATAQYRTSDKSSFGCVSAHERWPVILVSVDNYPISYRLVY